MCIPWILHWGSEAKDGQLKTSKLQSPHKREQIVKRIVLGESQEAIAKDFGIHQSSVSRFASRDDIQVAIEEAQKELLSCIPDAVKNVKGLVREFQRIPKNQIKSRQLSYKASQDVLKSVGLLSTPVQSQTFVNLYQQQNNTILSPVILRLLEAQRSEMEALRESEEADEDPNNA